MPCSVTKCEGAGAQRALRVSNPRSGAQVQASAATKAANKAKKNANDTVNMGVFMGKPQ